MSGLTGFDERTRRWILGGTVVGAVLVLLNLTAEVDAADATVLELVLDSLEILLMVAGAGGVGLLLQRMQAEHREKLALMRNLALARAEGEGWRSRVQAQVAGIGAEIDRQFDDWRLTSAEREVGILMLKGLSHKEIAAMRGTSEATVRQQARSVYQKSSLPSKSAFAAYFLEDLLPPAGVAPLPVPAPAPDRRHRRPDAGPPDPFAGSPSMVPAAGSDD